MDSRLWDSLVETLIRWWGFKEGGAVTEHVGLCVILWRYLFRA
jgi:hypothetical protein